MATRGSALSRVVKYFREEDLDVALIALTHIRNIVDARQRKEGNPVATGKKRGRKSKVQVEKELQAEDSRKRAARPSEATNQEESESLANA